VWVAGPGDLAPTLAAVLSRPEWAIEEAIKEASEEASEEAQWQPTGMAAASGAD
jgi:hypothetical protein